MKDCVILGGGLAGLTAALYLARGQCQVIDAAQQHAVLSVMISQVSQTGLKGFRFPRSVIAYAVWAYHRFALSLRDVEDLLAERGVTVRPRPTNGTWTRS